MEPQPTLHVGVEIVVSPARIADPKVRGPALQIPIQFLNRNLHGWAAYFRVGYPRRAYDNLNSYVQRRLGLHLDRRSQRRYRAPANVSLYAHLRQLGLRYLSLPRRSGKLFT